MIKVDWKNWALHCGLFGIRLSVTRRQNPMATNKFREVDFWAVKWHLGNIVIWSYTEPWANR